MRARLRWKARHTVLSVLGFTWIVTYFERTVMSVAMPYIAADYHLTPLNTGVVLGVFYAGYAIFQVPGGLLADLYGVRIVATISILWRAIFVALTAAGTSLTQLLAVRMLFGLGDGLFPGLCIQDDCRMVSKAGAHKSQRPDACCYAPGNSPCSACNDSDRVALGLACCLLLTAYSRCGNGAALLDICDE